MARELKVCAAAQSALGCGLERGQGGGSDKCRRTGSPFYEAYVLTGIAMNRDGNRMLWLASDAIKSVKAGDKAKAHQDVKEALAADRRDQADGEGR